MSSSRSVSQEYDDEDDGDDDEDRGDDDVDHVDQDGDQEYYGDGEDRGGDQVFGLKSNLLDIFKNGWCLCQGQSRSVLHYLN